nr:uncharacterized mitochondrial protein AtMg00810-like [Tanacetum cinerariifolium]
MVENPASASVVVTPKFDMHIYKSLMGETELAKVVDMYGILEGLLPWFPPLDLTVNNLPGNVMGIDVQQLKMSGGGYSKRVVKALNAVMILLRESVEPLLYLESLSTFWKYPERVLIFKDPEGRVIPRKRYDCPLSEGNLIPAKSVVLFAVERPTERVVAAKKKKKAQESLKAATLAKRKGGSVVRGTEIKKKRKKSALVAETDVFKNKKDERGIVIKNKARLVAQGFQVKQKEDGLFISQDKYVVEVLRKFNFSDVKSASTLVDMEKTLVKDADGDDVDVHFYKSMIGSLMYLKTSRPDIMYAICVCARYQVTPKVSHLYAVKRIFRYLKGHSKLGLWYPKDQDLLI